ncbi:hypothetical protein [uncultured Bacteroides sp.]|uniref:hypothetical protein n=1 Tax=uncultured Bacteroides sp. TaxID=162156 RepID=UPI003748CDF4
MELEGYEAWYTKFLGSDKKTGNDNEMQNAYLSYGEVSYPFIVNNVNLMVAQRVSPFESTVNCENKSFAATTISLKISRDIFVTDLLLISSGIMSISLDITRLTVAQFLLLETLRP